MLRERYYKRFSVRMEIIANNAIIILCHPVKVAIFAISNFFSLFGIAIFNIPITHIIIVLLFLMQSYCFFRYFQIFLTFFLLIVCRSPHNRKIYFMFLSFPVVVCSVGVLVLCRLWSCVRWSPDNHTHAHTYARTRTRTGIFRP